MFLIPWHSRSSCFLIEPNQEANSVAWLLPICSSKHGLIFYSGKKIRIPMSINPQNTSEIPKGQHFFCSSLFRTRTFFFFPQAVSHSQLFLPFLCLLPGNPPPLLRNVWTGKNMVYVWFSTTCSFRQQLGVLEQIPTDTGGPYAQMTVTHRAGILCSCIIER